MATKANTSKWHKNMDADEHIKTYDEFVKYGSITIAATVVILLAMLVFLV